MSGQTITREQIWANVQEPRCPVYMPTSDMLLLSALGNGWKIIKIELAPSWDQYGLVYLVSLIHQYQKHTQLLIMPMKPAVEKLIHERTLLGALD
jgi:hypothetical protein